MGAGLRADQRVERRDLFARDRSGQVVHRPARLEDDRLLGVHVVHQEDSLAQAGEQLVVLGAIDPRRRALQPVEKALLILVGLQAPEEPRAGVGEPFVVEIDGVLSRQQQAHPERSRLLEHAQHRRFRGGHGDRRQETLDLVEVDDGAQRGRPGLRPHPAVDGVEEQRHEEHALALGKMGDVKDRVTRAAVGGKQHAAHVKRLAFGPRLKRGRGRESC